MIYDYDCEKCDKKFEVVKSMSESSNPEKCPICENYGQRLFNKVTFLNEKVQSAEFNIGLGKVVKNSKHREELAKRMNLVEVGSEKVESIHKNLENDRAEKMKKSWDAV